MTLSSGSLASQGEEEHPELSRPRPTEKYWEDYEDWKVRPTTREERRERRERSSGKEKASLGGVGVRRSFSLSLPCAVE